MALKPVPKIRKSYPARKGPPFRNGAVIRQATVRTPLTQNVFNDTAGAKRG